MSSGYLSTISKYFKPNKAEAVQRLRSNILSFGATVIVSYLLPLPSLSSAFASLFVKSHHQSWTIEWLWEWACVLEIALITLFAYNILEAGYALKYPGPRPAVVAPSKPKAIPLSPFSTPKRPRGVLSPNTTPQEQKPFAFTPTASTSGSLSMSGSGYIQSPLSTPSRVLHYAALANSSTNTIASSTSSDFLATPSPVISAYRGKHSMDVGRALDASYLARVNPSPVQEED
ncbi:hypothetical protein D9619_001296 [Psilocybe cf. subviscida]|uniref:Uncharacterized protein n=1 Tax=Psilocybe cf. subviscida TaxID=2480587 RepID=A0A8H5BDP0_9AGAR|nr:hypothetical protein D9619_001296 [Psilocybe cf. subviscida]